VIWVLYYHGRKCYGYANLLQSFVEVNPSGQMSSIRMKEY
jgi:hypothetical protein